MKVEILIIIILSIIDIGLLQNNDDVQNNLYKKILGNKSKFFYRINYKIHSVTNKLFLSLKLNKNVRKTHKFQFLLKTHLYFNNKAQKYYEEYEKLVNPTSDHTCRIGDQQLDETIENIIQEKLNRIKIGLIYLLPHVIKTFNNENNTEYNITNNLFTNFSDKLIKNIIEPVVKNNTVSNDTMSMKDNISQDLNALNKTLKILEHSDTGHEDIAMYKELKRQNRTSDPYRTNNLTNILQNIVHKEIETIKNNLTKLADISQMHVASLLDIMTPKEKNTNISFENTLLTLSEKTMENVIDEILYDIKTPNDTKHTFDSVTLSSEELDLVLFPTNASIDNQIETRRIYHGKKTRVKSYPFLASLHLASEFLCAGSIISVDLLITAASCLQMVYKTEEFRSDPRTIFARVGSDFPKHSGKLIPIVAVVFHPKYDPVTLKNNLAIAKMLKKLKHTKEKKIKRIKYDKEPDVLKKSISEVKIIGWGARDEKDKQIGIQRPSVAHLDIYDTNDCKDIYSKYYVSETNFCAGFTSKGGGACAGDVGGPAVVSKKLVGVVSFGPTVCGMLDAPTVFTKVGYYADWIDEVIHTSQANQSMLVPVTVNSTELPQLVVIPVFTETNTTKKELQPVLKPQVNQGQPPASIVKLPTNQAQKPLPHMVHTMNQNQKTAILMKHLNQGQKVPHKANLQYNQGLKPREKTALRQGLRPPFYKNLQYGPRQKPLSVVTSQSYPKQILKSLEKSQISQNFNPLLKMNPLLRTKHVPNVTPQNDHSVKTFTYKNPAPKQDLIPTFIQQRHHPKHVTESISVKENKDELSIIQQVIQDMILGNETVIDYLTNEKVFDDISDFVEDSNGNSVEQLNVLKPKFNGNFDIVNPIIRGAKLQTSRSNNYFTAQTNAFEDESYYDGKPTQITTFIQSLENSKEDVSSYYEIEIPIEAAPFTKSPPGLDDESKKHKYINNYQDITTASNIKYETNINHGADVREPSNKIYHKAMDEEDHEALEKRQNNNNYSHVTISKDSFNIYHKDSDSDREIHKIMERNDRNQNRDLRSKTENNKIRDLRSQPEKNEKEDVALIRGLNTRNKSRDTTNIFESKERSEHRNSKIIIKINESNGRNMSDRNQNRNIMSMTENNEDKDKSLLECLGKECKDSKSSIERDGNRERSLPDQYKNRDERAMNERYKYKDKNNWADRNKNLNSRGRTERNEDRKRNMDETKGNRDPRSLTERNDYRDPRSMNERDEHRDPRGMNERNEHSRDSRNINERKEHRDPRSKTESNDHGDSRDRNERIERNDPRSVTERNEQSRDSGSMNDRKDHQDPRSMAEGNDYRNPRNLDERNEGKPTRPESRNEVYKEDDNSQLEKEINSELGAVAGVISQEDFNYAYNEEKGIEMRSRKGDQYYDFDFMIDYDY